MNNSSSILDKLTRAFALGCVAALLMGAAWSGMKGENLLIQIVSNGDGVIINADTTGWPVAAWQLNGTTQAIIGVARNNSGGDCTTAGTLFGDLCIRTQGTDIIVTTDSGTTNVFQFFAGAVRNASLVPFRIGTNGTDISESNAVSGTIDFGSISNGACADNTATLTGAAVNSPVSCSWPAALEAGLAGTCWISATNTVKFRLCNVTGSPIDPASATFGARQFDP